MIKTTFIAGLMVAAISLPALAASTTFYVEQDAKSHACMVSDKKPDGKTMMDVGTKAYDSKANAQKAMANLKACEAAATPAGFYVAEDAKTKKCAVSDKKPDGKMMMDVGTKMYDSKANAEKAMANLNACK
ncbi:MAG: hypothetical protein ABIN69_01285 [Aestuariivirga sp.]